MKLLIHVQVASVSLVLLGQECIAALNVPRTFLHTHKGERVDIPINSPITTNTRSTNTLSAPSWSNNNYHNQGKGRPLFSATTSESQTTTSADGEDGRQKLKQYSKLRALKDRMWVREAIEDLTAAEFACSVAQGDGDDDKETDNSEKATKIKNKRAVDFDNILFKLEQRIEDMCVRSTYGDGANDDNCIVSYPLSEGISSEVIDGGKPNSADECWSLKKNFGMASVTYTDEQRSALVMRLLSSRQNLINAMSGQADSKDEDDDGLDDIREKLQTPDAIDTEKEKDTSEKSAGDPLLYVRDDGTIDWDGALQDRAALKKFGTSVWARINGQDEDSVDANADAAADDSHASHGDKKVTAKIADTDAIREKKEKLDTLKAELKEMDKKHTALLNSAVSAGSAVAAVNLATLKPELRSKIRSSSDELEKKKDQVTYHTISYEIERIYTYLDGELGNTSANGYIPLQDRLNVAEFGLLESQFVSLEEQIKEGEIVDADVLAVLSDQTVDFKRRLGIDYYVTGLTFDQEAIKMWSSDLVEKSKRGLAFYGKGVQLLWNDCVFSLSLIGRALVGYTLKPREVRTVRRTFKDILTFIPFVIILIIPLSPVGHALVFGAIQRFFPDAFPSCFTERRQNLLNLYESTEFTQVPVKETTQEKFVRLLEAFGFLLVDNTKKAFNKVSGKGEEK